MKKKIFILAVLFTSIKYSYSQSKIADSIILDKKITDCEKLCRLSQIKEISINKTFIEYVNYLEKKTKIMSSLSATENGLIYLSVDILYSDIIKWRKDLKCK